MARQLAKKTRKQGFTLVELLIVVAIIGVLSTIGIPTFRRMVQKSKKAEAKTTLGGLYTAEQAFMSEYGSFGNHLSRVGFEVDGANALYTVGFPTSTACASAAAPTSVASPGGVVPAPTGTPMGVHLAQVYPSYYTPAPQLASSGTFEQLTSLYRYHGLVANCRNTANTTLDDGSADAGRAAGVYSGTAGDHNRFLAIAQGVIAPGYTKTDGVGPGGNVGIDVWTMNDKRVLSNFVDGVR